MNGFHGPDVAQVVQHAPSDEVAAVEDQVGPLEPANALSGETPRAARQMRVRDYGDDQRRERFGVPTANGTPMYVAFRARFISATSLAP